MRLSIIRAVSLAVLLAAGCATAGEIQLKPSAANYSVGWGSLSLGSGTITLTPQAEKDCYRYERQTHPIGLVRWTYGSPREASLFCIKDGVIRPSHFEYVNDKREKDNFTIDFDWSEHKAKVVKRGEIRISDLPERAYDRLVLDQAVRLWVQANAGATPPEPKEFTMVDDDRVITYRFAVSGHEAVETPVNTFDTLLVERVDDPNKRLRIWFALAQDYLPVKIENIKDGKLQLRMLLK